MYTKGNRVYSDWTGPDGKRRRKAHATSLAATRHEAKMKRESGARPHGGPRSRIASVTRTSPVPISAVTTSPEQIRDLETTCALWRRTHRSS